MHVDHVAAVTAGSRGIGAACARELVRRGYAVSLMSRTKRAVELARELGGVGLQGTVASEDDLRALISLTMRTYGRVDVVVNNTGNPDSGELLDLADRQWQEGIDIILMNVIRMSRVITPIMLEQGKGSIVNISAADACEPDLRFPITGVLRASLGGYTKLYATRYAAKGIRMNSVLPGFTFDEGPNEWFDVVRREVPMRRPASYDEIAKAVAFLASDDASYITGQSLRVDGGHTRSL